MQQFKIRASEAHNIMGVKSLGKTGESYCEKWLKEQLYSRRKTFESKYTDKGLTQEDAAIEFASGQLGWGMVAKNSDRLNNELMEGTPDIILSETIEDIKCSWDCFTFPLFDTSADSDYVTQLNIYMHLTGKKQAGIVYCLMDAPEHLIDREARQESFKQGFEEVPAELYEEVRLKMSYSHLAPELRLRRFAVSYDPALITKLESRVIECRAYIQSLGYGGY